MSIPRNFSFAMMALLGACSIASAAPLSSSPLGATPEMNMLENVLALQGKSLPADQIRAQISDAVTKYVSSAPREGQQERFQQALVNLGMYNANEAANLMADAENAPLTAERITQIANAYPMGAQFSSCAAETAGVILTTVGGIGFIVALLTPHYPDNMANSFTYCNNGVLDTSSPCSTADYWHSDSDRNHELIGTGIAAVIGVILLHFTQGGC